MSALLFGDPSPSLVARRRQLDGATETTMR
jgi:hypothetical protein